MRKILKSIICIAAAGVMLSQTAFAAGFSDVDTSHWANSEISSMADEGVLSGYEDGTFKPENEVTRAEWAKMLSVKAKLDTTDDTVKFDDMTGSWANIYVNAVSGFLRSDDSEFRPNVSATRADVAVSLVKALNISVSGNDETAAFSDASDISDDDKPYISAAVTNGLVTGYEDNTFRPNNSLTRAEAAVLLYRAYGSETSDNSSGTSGGTSSKHTSNDNESIINASIELSNGEKINLELYPDIAPKTVANFVQLAKEGKYDGTIFHRVIKDFMIQGGGYDLGFNAVDADNIEGEFSENGFENTLSHTRGVISMARAQDYNSASSQFFIMHKDTPSLDGQYAAFGKVADDASMAVVDSIAEVETGTLAEMGFTDVPVSPVLINTITISE